MSSRKKDKKLLKFIEVVLLFVGIMIMFISILSLTYREISHLILRVNFLSFAIGVLYVLFALLLRKISN